MPDLLPPNATKQERDISLALDRLPAVPIKTLWTPATCPEAQLPWLAWALSVDEWDAAWPVETKRQVIAASIEQHRKKGTVGALRRALQRLGYEVEIDEATGVAYTFRLRVRIRAGDSAGGAVSEDALNRALTVALRQKNARSSLAETLYVADTDGAGLFIGGLTMSGLEYEAKVTADYTLPPSDLVIEQTGSAQVSATWNGAAEYYVIDYYPSSIIPPDFGGQNAYVDHAENISVLAGEYVFRVRAFAGGYFSSWLSSAPFTVIIVPPSGLAADTATAERIEFTWTNVEPLSETQIRNSGDDWGSPPYSASVEGPSYAIFTGVSPGFYDLRVRSIGTVYPGSSGASEWVEILNVEVI